MAQRLLRECRAVRASHGQTISETVSMKKPPTGEPYAGKPPVRFGGRGRRKPIPTPIRERLAKHNIVTRSARRFSPGSRIFARTSCSLVRDTSGHLFLKRVLPAARRGPRRIGRFQIIEHDLALVAVERRHVVPLGHPVERVVPLPTRLPLLGDELEAVAGRAGIEGLVASGPGRIVLRLLVARREGRRLRESGRRREHEQRRQTENEEISTAHDALYFVMAGLVPAIQVFAPSTKTAVDARDKPGHDGARRIYATRIATRCSGLPP